MKNTSAYLDHYKKIIENIPCDANIKTQFAKRISEGAITRDENPSTHLCVYFAAFDPVNKQVFIGHHKKANQWLFNGGHVDLGELPIDTLKRETGEEWGNGTHLQSTYQPEFLTITKINNILAGKCQLHYDIWYFIPLDMSIFNPDPELTVKEFYEMGWKSITTARKLVTDPNNLAALAEIEKHFI
ncbi:MAG: NUDIX domain-containing protein [bacterium]